MSDTTAAPEQPTVAPEPSLGREIVRESSTAFAASVAAAAGLLVTLVATSKISDRLKARKARKVENIETPVPETTV